MLTSDGKYRSERAIKAREEKRRANQAAGKCNHTKKKWIENNPEKRAAHVKLGNAVRDGIVNKPSACPICSRVTRIIGHHADYSRPLDVKWMCGKCHRTEHQ